MSRLLDCFCGAGGAAMGYYRAGFTDILGIDQAPQKNYPFRFQQGDALAFLATVRPGDFDLIHCSPPCQAYSSLRAVCGEREYPDLIDPVRQILLALGTPYVIENVMGAPVHHGVRLCGTMFGLRVYRHRWFETSRLILSPPHPVHVARAGGHKSQRQRKAHYLAGGFVTVTGNVGSYCGPALGINWMTGEELSQAVPPAYTTFVGRAMAP